MNLKDQYEVRAFDVLMAELFKIHRNIPRIIKKTSFRRYGKKNNLARYFCDKHYGISVGKYTYGFEPLCNKTGAVESVGSFCSIAIDVKTTAGNHPIDSISTHPATYLKRFGLCESDEIVSNVAKNQRVKIGNDVWIGRDVVLLPSVRIGNGAIIGAGAVVTKDIPDYAIAVGVPAKVIKYRFNPAEIELLNMSQWWHWDDYKIKAVTSLFSNPQQFLEFIAKEQYSIA